MTREQQTEFYATLAIIDRTITEKAKERAGYIGDYRHFLDEVMQQFRTPNIEELIEEILGGKTHKDFLGLDIFKS